MPEGSMYALCSLRSNKGHLMGHHAASKFYHILYSLSAHQDDIAGLELFSMRSLLFNPVLSLIYPGLQLIL